MTTNPPPTLASVAQQFADWRRTRTNLKTPLALREQAVNLLASHPVGQVCKGLNINHDMVKRWRRELVAELPVPAFVTLPAALPSPQHDEAQRLELTLAHQGADGSTLSLSGQLSPTQWRWAVQLVHQRP